jgi:hypothetical protein
MCGYGGSIYNKDTSQNTLSASLLALTMIDPATGWFEIFKETNKSAASIQDFFITPGWHVTSDLNLLFLTIGLLPNSNVSSKQCEHKTIMTLKPYQLQVTSITYTSK